ncbi:MAG: ABC transporter substrate-binding protein [Firmicutes bacterium]|jgi:peptide/nickel transport system substrate-binding protein|nr:ABC transporter substrate-binding protein [Bacillota bacterium]
MVSKNGRIARILSVFFVLMLPLLIGAIAGGQAPNPQDSIIRESGSFPLYPDPAVGNGNVECIALCNLYDSLVFPHPIEGIKPHLATDWSVSPDGLKHTFKLRRGVKFHNGDELTAEDVVFSMERLLTIGEGFAYLFNDVTGAAAIDKYTVEFSLREPFGPFVEALVRLYILNKNQVMANIIKPGQYDEFGDYGKRWLLTNDAGSGPYMLKEMKLEEHLLAKKFEDYWQGFEGDAPGYFKLISSCEPVTVRTMLARRELEITDMWQPMENLLTAAKIEGVELAHLPCVQNLQIMLNTKRAPTDDIHFRKALAHCMDYNTISERIYIGSPVSQGPVISIMPGHNRNLKLYEFDLEKAQEELRKSKYYNERSKYPVAVSWSADVPEEEKIALLLQANAAKLGIEIEIQKRQWGQIIAAAQTKETTPHGSVMFVGTHYPEAGSMLKSRYHSSTCGTWEQQEWLEDAEIDAMIEKALKTIDQKKRFSLYADIQDRLMELCPTIWLVDHYEIRAYQAGYMDWPLADHMEAGGEIVCPAMGYSDYFRDMKIYPEKRAALTGR